GAGSAGLRRAAVVVLPGTRVARRGAAQKRRRGGSRARLPQGPRGQSWKRPIAVRIVAGAPSAGKSPRIRRGETAIRGSGEVRRCAGDAWRDVMGALRRPALGVRAGP